MAKLLVLGVDPGTRWAGLVVLRGGSALVDRARLDLQRMARDPDDPNSRILALQRAVEAWLARYQPGVLAVEDPAHPRNAHTAQLLGRAVWACVQPALSMGLLVAEYRPGQVRRALPEVRRQLGADGAWSDDELAAAGAAWCALVDLGLADQEPAQQRGPETRTRASGCARPVGFARAKRMARPDELARAVAEARPYEQARADPRAASCGPARAVVEARPPELARAARHGRLGDDARARRSA